MHCVTQSEFAICLVRLTELFITLIEYKAGQIQLNNSFATINISPGNNRTTNISGIRTVFYSKTAVFDQSTYPPGCQHACCSHDSLILFSFPKSLYFYQSLDSFSTSVKVVEIFSLLNNLSCAAIALVSLSEGKRGINPAHAHFFYCI